MALGKKWIPKLAAAVFVLGLVLGIVGINKLFGTNIDNERKNQLKELTVQVRDTFGNALSFNESYSLSAKRMFESGTYADESDVVAAAGSICESLDFEETGKTLVLIDENGYCYDEDGRKGIWGDFDQLSGGEQSYTFISDSTTYEGTHWAFAQKLDTPVTTGDGEITLTYVVVLCPVETVSGYYLSESYDEVGETYILKENGTRMYDSVTEDDTIQSYNIYKALRESEGGYGESFDSVLEELEQNGTASGIYVQDGEKYCYSLAWHRENQTVIMYLVPASQVAADTTQMVSTTTKILMGTGILIMIFLSGVVYVVSKTRNDRKLIEQKEENLREVEEMNARLRAMNESLNDANKAAQSALAVAESANRAKSSFLSNMSHDIRTPLNAIIGCQKLLDANVDNPEKVREYSDKIAVAGNHLLALINDILDMSRIESGKTTLNQAPFGLERFVEELRTMVMTQAQNKHQTFVVDNMAGNLAIVGDQPRLNQILTNLLSNAVKYTPDGGRIEFRAERLPSDNARMALIRFIVRDNGVGMGEEFQKRIFEPFTREESALVNGISGTGLGMSITKNLVDLMGGIITVESRRGEGSTFTVELTFRLADEAGHAEDETEGMDLTGTLNGCHFLMAEDTAINAEILTGLLEMEGASCDVANNGQKAVEMFEGSAPGTYDAILMDVQMPVMDGYEATRLIRKSSHPEATTIPIAALTANAFAEDVQRAIEAGMNTHIAKPVDMEKLREFMVSINKE